MAEEKILDEKGITIVHLSDDDATALAKEVIADKARGYYPAAQDLARVVLGQRSRIRVASILHQSLKETQARCTELLDEVRALKRELIGARTWHERFQKEAESHELTLKSFEEAIRQRNDALANLAVLREEHIAICEVIPEGSGLLPDRVRRLVDESHSRLARSKARDGGSPGHDSD